ncbi:MAG: penicillin acylase family protein, partial [Thermoactinospora sp.]|nr:penicillin acylase family protein [Thermoactinospora sp.]
ARPETVSLPGLTAPATVAFEDNGLAHVTAGDDDDLFRTIGYVHARFRLSQMDLTRRQAQGELAEIVGPDALESDRFERDLGLRRAARRDWAALPEGPARKTLVAYSRGVNDAIGELVRDHRLPTLFTVLGYEPRPWTPVDTLAVQRLVGQKISFDEQAVRFSFAQKALGQKVFDQWFPVVPGNRQQPFDKGPFKKLPLTPLPKRAYPEDGGPAAAAGQPATPPTLPPTTLPPTTVPASAVHTMGNSNSWVVSGSRTASGAPILSADPHLPYSLPSIWYQLEGSSPGYHFSGATTPGIPVPLLGKTDAFSWGLTASQRPTTLFYEEGNAPAGLTTVAEPIKVRGRATELHQVRLTAHGPLMRVQTKEYAVWWAGTLPSDNMTSMLTLLRARNLGEFRASLRGWVTPALNFSYAGGSGDIAMFNVGAAPQVASGNPALPLAGDGSGDVTGSIAPDALPASVNPPEGYIVSANQREASGDYPYQYSTSYNYVERGWRDGEIVEQLSHLDKLTLAQSAALQADWHDNHARQLVPLLLNALKGVRLNPDEQRVAGLLAAWDYTASPDKPQPVFFDSFKNRLSWATFQPWWTHYKVPQDPDKGLLPRNPDAGAWANETLRGTVLGWIQHDPGNAYFSLPDGTRRDATDLLRDAFHQTVAATVGKYGPDVGDWAFGKYESVLFPNLAGMSALDLGPYRGWGGNPRTPNVSVGTRDAEDGRPLSNLATAGATWRFGVDWGTGQVQSMIAGGQSENPMSPWYGNGIPLWMKGRYWTVLEGAAVAKTRTVRWKVTS